MTFRSPRVSIVGLAVWVFLGGCDVLDPVPIPAGIPFGDFSACVQTDDGPVSLYVYTVRSGGTLAGDGWVMGNATVYRHLGEDRRDDQGSTFYIADGTRYRSEVSLRFADDGPVGGREGPTIGGEFTIEGRTSLDERIPDRIEGTFSATWGTSPITLVRTPNSACSLH